MRTMVEVPFNRFCSSIWFSEMRSLLLIGGINMWRVTFLLTSSTLSSFGRHECEVDEEVDDGVR